MGAAGVGAGTGAGVGAGVGEGAGTGVGAGVGVVGATDAGGADAVKVLLLVVLLVLSVPAA